MTAVATLTVNPSLDLESAVDRVRPDDKLRCEPPSSEPGGGGLNVARVLSELGEPARAVHTAGGSTGERLQALLEGLDVELRPVGIAGETRQSWTFTSLADDDQYRFVLPGPRLHEREWRRCADTLLALEPPPELAVLSGSLPPGVPDDFYADLAAALAPRGVRVVVDASGAPLRRAAEQGVFLLKPNARELGQLVGTVPSGGIEAAADELVDGGAAEVVVLSLGRAGAYVTGRQVDGQRIPAPAVPLSSRIGAGDSMVGALAAGLVRGWDVVRATRYAVAAGAAAVMTPGSQLCRREDVERLFAGMTA